ncbi:MAG: S9 family peptidase [Polyangiaceae bacterium]|nr:S9 family peptidase [Polyangiaceae bacterium]
MTPPATKPLAYPENHPGDAVDTLFGQKVADPYRWLEDENAPNVKTWVDAQDKLARAELSRMPERDAIATRLKELLYIDSLSAPRKRGQRYFYSRRHADKEKAIVYVKDGEKGKERILLDPNAWSSDGSVSLGTWSPTWDGKKVAYAQRANNADEATLYVLDVDTMKKSEVDVIEGAKYAYPSWTPSGDGFYYTWLPIDPKIKPADRPGFAEVRFHKLGSDPKTDEIIHEKTGNASKFIGSDLTKDGKFFFLSIDDGWTSNELHFRDGRDKKAKLTRLADAGKGHYRADGFNGNIYVMTDEGAPRWRVFRVDPKKPERAAWVEVVKEDPTATLDTFAIIGGKLVLSYLDKASSRLEIRELDGAKPRKVDLPGLGTVSGLVGQTDDDEAYYMYESFTAPLEVHKLSIKSGKASLYSKVKVPIDADKFTSEQVEYKSKDGTVVTMFIVRPKEAKKDGSNRVLLYGYGGFQVNETPSFWATLYPWLERGGILAVPNLRGGGEYGEAWHQDGMKLKKQNVFDDFIGAAKFLIKENWTKPQKMVISGASNGGLLVGAVMTQAPDLFAGVLCGVPLLDMVRYHQFGSGRTWISEYGSAENEPEFRALYAYSPYHHVKAEKYPALLMLASDHDDRVDPLHARKFVAAVQDRSTGGPVLLRVERNAGHGGADLRKAEVEKGADRIAFALSVTSDKAQTQ